MFPGVAFILLPLLAVGLNAQKSDVPAEYRDLYAALESKIETFEHQVPALDDRGAPPQFCAELLVANANRGKQLLNERAWAGTLVNLDRLQSLGATGVVVAIGYPILSRSFHEWNGTAGDASRYLAFYKRLSNEVHRRGMKLVVESSVLFPGVYSIESGFKLTEYYKSQNDDQYVAGRVEVAELIAREVHPDYLNMGAEPDTEATLIGRNTFRTPRAHAELIHRLATAARTAGTSSLSVGGGVSTWLPDCQAYASELGKLRDIDFIDLHVYPVNRSYLQQLIRLTDIAQAAGKQVTIMEAWLFKERDSELGTVQAAVDASVFARDSYSFWAPLDQKFLAAMAKFCHWKHVRVLSPFWSQFFFAYVNYDDVKGAPVSELRLKAQRAAAAAMVSGNVNETGETYRRLAHAKPAL